MPAQVIASIAVGSAICLLGLILVSLQCIRKCRRLRKFNRRPSFDYAEEFVVEPWLSESANGPRELSYLRICLFAFPGIMNSKRRDAGRRKMQRKKREAGNIQARASIEKASLGVWNVVPLELGPDEPPSQLVMSQPPHRQTSYASGSQATTSSIASTERQQSLRERAESMRGGMSALQEILLNENIPERQRRAAQAELRQLRSILVMLSMMEQSDWARGLVDEPPPAYNTLFGR
jgi:hypothetical protein